MSHNNWASPALSSPKGDYGSNFMQRINQTYGIPLGQLQMLKEETQNVDKVRDEADEQEEGKYTDQLAMNHNILKQMLRQIDEKSNKEKEGNQEVRPKEVKQEEKRKKLTNPEMKLWQVRRMLKDITVFIDQNCPASAPVHQSKDFQNKGETSIDYSLQYSRDFETSPMQRGQIITIDRSKLDNAPQVESYQVLHQPTPTRPLKAHEYLKPQLQEIGQVQSGETIPSVSPQMTPSLPEEQTSPREQEEQPVDETRQQILSAIQKHKQTISRGNTPQKTQQQQMIKKDMVKEKEQARKNRLWHNKPKIDLMSQNTVVSFETLEDKHTPIKPRFASLNKKFSFRSPSKPVAAPTNSPIMSIKAPQPTHSPLKKPQLVRPTSHKEILVMESEQTVVSPRRVNMSSSSMMVEKQTQTLAESQVREVQLLPQPRPQQIRAHSLPQQPRALSVKHNQPIPQHNQMYQQPPPGVVQHYHVQPPSVQPIQQSPAVYNQSSIPQPVQIGINTPQAQYIPPQYQPRTYLHHNPAPTLAKTPTINRNFAFQKNREAPLPPQLPISPRSSTTQLTRSTDMQNTVFTFGSNSNYLPPPQPNQFSQPLPVSANRRRGIDLTEPAHQKQYSFGPPQSF